MLATHLLSEAAHGPDLTWLLFLVLGIFFVVIIIGWKASGKEEAAPAHEESHHHHAEEAASHEEERAETIHVPDAPAEPDNLKKLEGIGPKVEQVLHKAGYRTYADLAAADADAVRAVLADSKMHMMDPSGWIEQAELAAKGDWESLEKLQDELIGGRRVH